MNKKLKISITGPESTGKSTLAGELCQHFDAEPVIDFSRKYFDKKAASNDYEDIVVIAKKQIRLEIDALELTEKSFIICDTDLINIKIWLKYYNYNVPQFVEDHLKLYPNDLSLLLYPNTKWQEDGLRNNEHDRLALYEKFQKELAFYNYPFHEIKKLDTSRLHQAILEIDNFLKF